MRKNNKRFDWLKLLINYLESGFSLRHSLVVLENEFDEAYQLNQMIINGRTVSDAIQDISLSKILIDTFLVLNQIMTVESSFKIAYNLYIEIELIKKDFINRLLYPVFLLCFSIIIIFLISFMVTPQIEYLNDQIFNTDNYSSNKFILSLIKYLPFIIIFIILLLFIITLLIHQYYKEKPLKIIRFALKFRFFKAIISSYYSYLFSYFYCTYLDLGMNDTQIIHLMALHFRMPVLKHYIMRIENDILGGSTIKEAINQPIFLESFKHILIHSFEVKNAKELVNQYNQNLLLQLKDQIKKLSMISSVIIMIFIAILIAIIYISLFLPILNLTNQI